LVSPRDFVAQPRDGRESSCIGHGEIPVQTIEQFDTAFARNQARDIQRAEVYFIDLKLDQLTSHKELVLRRHSLSVDVSTTFLIGQSEHKLFPRDWTYSRQ